MVGGLGICGRPLLLCPIPGRFPAGFHQNGQNPEPESESTKISGTCGRLMCCLKYEQEAYEDLLKTSPKPESLWTLGGPGTVVDVNLLRQA